MFPLNEIIISSLKEKINRQQWELWFSSFGVKEATENKVVFEVANFFTKEHLEQKFSTLIKKTLREIYGKNVDYEMFVLWCRH